MSDSSNTAAGTSMPGLSESQRGLLHVLKRLGTATTPVLAEEVGLNVETVRHHLKRLEELQLVQRAGRRRSGPGRPEVVHALTTNAELLFPRREGEVLRALVEHLKSTGNEQMFESFFSSYIDGRRPHALARVSRLEGRARVEEVARILTELGFMAVAEGAGKDGERDGGSRTSLRLCHCPLRDLVDATSIPCRVEMHFVSELLGSAPTRLSYIPAGASSCSYETGGCAS